MKNIRNLIPLLLSVMTVSCATTGQFMPASFTDSVIGTVQADFVAVETWFTKDAINTQAYIQLLKKANSRYSEPVDIRDIVWTTGKNLDGLNKEIVATGRVIRIGQYP